MRKQKRNATQGLAAVVVAMASLSGCGEDAGAPQAPTPARNQNRREAAARTQPETQAEAAGELVMPTYWHHDTSESIVTPLKKVVAGFEIENPNTETDFLALSADSFYQKYVAAVATNTAPDIFGIQDMELLALVSQNTIVPLNDYLDRQDEKGKITQSIWDSVDSYTGDGKIYMVPSYMNTRIMWYNMKEMGEAGVGIPTTIGEFLRSCETYARPKESSYFYSLRDGIGSYNNLFIFLMFYAGTDGLFSESRDCTLSQDILAEAVDNYAGIRKNGWISRDGVASSYKEMMAESDFGVSTSMSHNSTSTTDHRRNLGEDNLISATHPTGKSGKTIVPVLSIAGAAVTTQSSHPTETVKFVEYLGTHSAASYFCQTAGKTPANDLMYEDQWYKENPYMGKYSGIMNSDSVILYNNPIWLTEWANLTGQNIVSDFQVVLMRDKESKGVLNSWAGGLTPYQQGYLKRKQ